jgi:2-oxoisovalerate dehydrogenase E1 component beta subunit
MPQMNMVEAIRSALADAMAEDERVFVLGEDVAVKGGVFLATDGLLKRFGEDRVVDMPIAEAGIVGIAIGASLHGLRPVAEIQFADYIHPAIDQILNEAARFRYRSNGDWSCPIVVRAPFGAGVHGGFYHSQSIEALFVSTPGIKVVAPSTPYDAKGLLIAEHAFEQLDGPVRRLASPDLPAVAFNDDLEAHFMLNAEKIADAIRSLAAY